MKNEITTSSPVAKYRLEITLPRDLAPHLAYRLTEMRHDLAYIHVDALQVKMTVNWTATSHDPIEAATEIASLQIQKIFPHLANIKLFGPL